MPGREHQRRESRLPQYVEALEYRVLLTPQLGIYGNVDLATTLEDGSRLQVDAGDDGFVVSASSAIGPLNSVSHSYSGNASATTFQMLPGRQYQSQAFRALDDPHDVMYEVSTTPIADFGLLQVNSEIDVHVSGDAPKLVEFISSVRSEAVSSGDTIWIIPSDPSLIGRRATVTATVQLMGALTFDVETNGYPDSDIISEHFAYVSALAGLSAPGYRIENRASVDADGQVSSTTESLTPQILTRTFRAGLGQASQIELGHLSSDLNLSNLLLPGDYELEIDASISWNGIQEVQIQNGPTLQPFQVAQVSESGFDYLLGQGQAVRNIIWPDAAGGEFSKGSNWVGGKSPTFSDNAIFYTRGDYTVDVDGSASLAAIYGRGNETNVTFAVNGDSLHADHLVVASTMDDRSSFTFEGPGTVPAGSNTLLTFEEMWIGIVEQSEGKVALSGPSASTTVSIEAAVGLDGKGTLLIRDGAEFLVEIAGLSIGAGRLGQNILGGSHGDGDVTVTGAGSKLTAPILSIANNYSGSVGRLKVLDGGEAVFEQGHVGDSAGPLNQVPPPGAGNSAGSVEVRGGVLRFTRSFADDVVNFVPAFDVQQGVALVVGGEGRVEVDGTTDFSTVVSRTVVVGLGEGPKAEVEVKGTGAGWDADTIFVSPVYDSPGAFHVKDGATVHSDSLHLTGQSQLFVSQGGRLTTSADATIGVPFTVLAGGAPVAGDMVTASAGVTGSSSVWEVDGELTVGGGGQSPQGSGILQVDNGGTLIVSTLNLQQGGVLQGDGLIKGTLQGNGVNNFAGQILPGNSPGTLTIEGNYTQGADGTLVLEIGGNTPGTEYDQLVVTGNVQLAGTLEVVFVDGYVPSANETFDFIVAGSIAGQFDDVMVQGLPAGTEVEFDPVTGDLTVTSGDEPDEPGNPPAMPTFGVMAATTGDVTPAIVFHAVDAADSYDVRIYDVPRGQEVFAQDGLQATSVAPSSPLRAVEHQAFVRAVNSVGISQWAGPFVFSVLPDDVGVPTAPTLISPDLSNAANTPEFAWSDVADADGYELVVYNMRLGQEVLHADGLAGTSYTPMRPFAQDRHQAFVRAVNTAGAGLWSAPQVFDVLTGDQQISEQPEWLQPQGTPTTSFPQFVWNAVDNAERYELLVYHVDSGREVARQAVTDTSHRFAEAFSGGRHQAFVRATDSSGPRLWSNPFEFEIDELIEPDPPLTSFDMEDVLAELALV